MYELIATIILLISLFGIAVILFRKIPVLVEMPSQTEKPLFFLLRLRQTIEEKKNLLSPVASEKFLEKLLHRVRILCLKAENKTSSLLKKLQQSSQYQKNNFPDNYWQELRKIKNQKSKIRIKKKLTKRAPR